jgi:hypothetical protein
MDDSLGLFGELYYLARIDGRPETVSSVAKPAPTFTSPRSANSTPPSPAPRSTHPAPC